MIWLLNHGADKEIKDIQGRTAEDLVEERHDPFITKLNANALIFLEVTWSEVCKFEMFFIELVKIWYFVFAEAP